MQRMYYKSFFVDFLYDVCVWVFEHKWNPPWSSTWVEAENEVRVGIRFKGSTPRVCSTLDGHSITWREHIICEFQYYFFKFLFVFVERLYMQINVFFFARSGPVGLRHSLWFRCNTSKSPHSEYIIRNLNHKLSIFYFTPSAWPTVPSARWSALSIALPPMALVLMMLFSMNIRLFIDLVMQQTIGHHSIAYMGIKKSICSK